MGLTDMPLDPGPTHNNQARMMDEQYARAMGQAPWNMRWSTAGAIGMGTAGYEAWSARGGLTLGHVETGIKDKPSPPGFWHDPHIGPDGLVPMSSELESRILSGLDGTNISGHEITKAVWVDPSTGRLTPSTYTTTGSTPFQGSQMGFPPTPPKGSGLSVDAARIGTILVKAKRRIRRNTLSEQ